MALLELGQRKYSIPVGEVVLGSAAGWAISLTGAGVLPRPALLLGQADGQVVIRKAAPAAEVTINGVRLGSEPTPLLHGDKVEVGDHELTFVDERRSGSTQYVQSEEHTSELQSRLHLVCRLLLEKKKQRTHPPSYRVAAPTPRADGP